MSRTFVLSVSAAALALAFPSSAHHSTTGYDYGESAQLELTGTILENHWVNPHSFVELDVPVGRSGGHEQWNVETGNPPINSQMGWRRDSLQVGMVVTMIVHPARNGRLHGTASVTTLPDGTKLYGPGSRIVGNGPTS